MLGFGVVESGNPATLIECGVVRTSATQALQLRLAVVHEGVTELIQRHRPDVIAVEGVFYGKNGRGAALKNQVGYAVMQLLRLRAAPKPADAADAVAIALTHLLVGPGRNRIAPWRARG